MDRRSCMHCDLLVTHMTMMSETSGIYRVKFIIYDSCWPIFNDHYMFCCESSSLVNIKAAPNQGTARPCLYEYTQSSASIAECADSIISFTFHCYREQGSLCIYVSGTFFNVISHYLIIMSHQCKLLAQVLILLCECRDVLYLNISAHNIIGVSIATLKALKFFRMNRGKRGDQRVFQFEIIINVLVSSFWFIWIPMLCVYGHYKYVYSNSAGIAFRRQNLTSEDVRFWRLKSIPAL